MKKRPLLLILALLLLCGCGPKLYEPAGEPTGDEALDDAVLAVLREVCDPEEDAGANVGAVYDWVVAEIQYRPGTADTSGGFTDQLVNELAAELLEKRRGNCDGEAALTAALLRRMGCEATVVTGQFQRDGQWVDHAWVIAEVSGSHCHVDTLYGRFYAQDRSYCMASDSVLEATHRWDQDVYPVCP